MRSIIKVIVGVAAALVMLFGMAACSGSHSDPQQSESKTQQSSYQKLVDADPAQPMTYSPTRKTINFWTKTWNKPGQLAYVYLQNAEGKLIGYYVLEGPPVSMCAALTPTYKFVDPPGDGAAQLFQVPAPSIDGVYYSGGQCDTYYGEDATTHAYIEYTVGLGINVLLYTQPLPNHPNVVNLSPGK